MEHIPVQNGRDIGSDVDIKSEQKLAKSPKQKRNYTRWRELRRGERGNILIDTDLGEFFNLKEVCHDFDFPPQFSKMSAFFKAVHFEVRELLGQMRRHFEEEFASG